MRRIIFFTALLVCLGLFSRAQKPKRYFGFTSAFSFPVFYDEGMSPVRYSGPTMGTELEWQRRSLKSINRLSSFNQVGVILPAYMEALSGPAYSMINHTDYLHLRKYKVLDEGITNWYLGGGLHTKSHIRFNQNLDNGALSYEIMTSASVATSLDIQFSVFKRDFLLNYQIFLPFVSYIVTPNYIGVYELTSPELDVERNLLTSGKFVSFDKFQRYQFQSELYYFLKNGNAFRLRYSWDYFNYNSFHRVQGAIHALSFSFMFNF